MKKNPALEVGLAEARAAWRRGEQAIAARQARRVFDDFAEDPRAAIVYAEFCLSTFRDPDLAISVLRERLGARESGSIFQRLAWYLAKANRTEEALNLASEYLHHPRLGAAAHLCYGGAWLLLDRDFDTAVGFFRKAAELPNCGRSAQVAAAITSLDDFKGLADVRIDATCNPVTFVNVPPAAPEFVWFASADESYFRSFFRIFSESFFAHHRQPASILHFHLFDPGDELREEIAGLAGNPAFSRVCFSFEQTNRKNRSYYYVGRFVQLPRLLERYQCPVAVSDIDCAFSGPIEPLRAAISAADFGHLEIDAGLLPWARFKAGVSVFRPTAAGYAFAQALRNFLLRAAGDDTNFWWFDQTGLAQCVYLSRKQGFGQIADITPVYRKVCFVRTHQKTGKIEEKVGALQRFLRERRSGLDEEDDEMQEIAD